MPKIVTDPEILALFDSAETPAATTPSASPKASFVSSLLPFAQASAAKSGLPVELVLAQAALESGWGRSAKGNNYFGIKAHGYGGKTQSVGTHEYENGKRVNITDTFRAYDSPEQSFDDHADFLRSNRRYKPVFEARDGIEAARALQKAGYATDPKYADKLISIMESPEIKSAASRQGQAPAAATGAAAKRQGTPVTDPKILALFDDTPDPNPSRHPGIAYLLSLQKKPEAPQGKGFFGDMGAAIWQGFVNVLEGDAYTVGRVTGSETVMAGADALKAHSERVHAGMDEDMRAGAEKKWVTEDNKALGDAWGDADAWKYVIGSGLGSIAGTILGGGIIKVGARFAIKRALTAGVKREVAKGRLTQKAAEKQVAEKIKKLDPYIGMGAYGAAEGAAIAGNTGRQVVDTITAMPAETLNTSPYFQEVYWENRDAFAHLSDQEVYDLSRKQVAMGASSVAMAKAGSVGVLLGTVAGKYLDDALNARTGGGMASRVGTQIGVQGGTESLQAGYEQYAGNEAIQDYANPAQDPWAGTGNAAVGEAIGGGFAGGLLGIPGAKPAADAANPAANASGAADPAADPAIGEPLTDPIKRIGQAGTVEEALAAANDAMLPVEFDRSAPELTASPGAAPEEPGIDPGIPFAGSLEGVGLETPEEAQRRTRTDVQGRRVLGQGPLDAPQIPMGMPQGGLLSGTGLSRPTAETSEELAASQHEREEQARRTQDDEIAWNNQSPRNPALGDALEQARVERRETRTLKKEVVGEGQSAPGAPKGDLADSSFHVPGKLTRDITRQSGKPFSTEEGARNSAKIRKLTGYTPVEVKGGWILRRNQDLHLKPNDPPKAPSVPDSTPPKGPSNPPKGPSNQGPSTGFTPTHITPDGTEVRQILDGEGNPIAGLYEDADGVEIEDDAAEPISHSESGETTVDGQADALGAKRRVMGLDATLTGQAKDADGIEYQLWDAENGAVVRAFDTEAGEVVALLQYPDKAKARQAFDDTVRKNGAKADEESATVKPPKSGQQLSGSQAESQAKQADSQTKVAGEDEAKPPKTDRPKGWQPIGENAEGETVFEDENGVRSVVSNGIRSTETVQVGIKRGGVETSVNPDTRDERFKPASDQFSNYKSFIEAQSWLDFGGLTNQIWTDERLEDGEAEILIDLIERKTKDQPNKGPHFAAGRKAFQEGKPRTLPSYFTTPDSKNARDWYRGWDSAQDDKPDTNSKPDQSTQKERYLQSIQLNPEQDSLLIAIAKLGGLDRNEAQAQGIDPASFKTRSGLIGKPIFRKTHGLSFDAMAEQLSQYGYVSEDYSANELLDKVDAELRGERQFTPNGTIANEERNLADQEEDPFLDGSTDDELDESGFTDLDAESQDYAAAVASARVKLGDEAVDAIMERLAVAHPNVSTDHYYELAQDALKEAIDEANTEQAPAGGRGSRRPAGEDTPQEDFSLTGQTEAERRAEEQRLAAAEQKRRREASEAEQKRKADAERDSFTLTGSDLPADANPNQADLLGAARPPQQADPFAGNKIFTPDKVAAARERLKKKLGQLNSGIDPEILQDGITIAGAYIESGVRDFAAYAKAMVGDFGDAIKPFLRSFYEGARYYPGLDTEGMTTAAEIDKLDLDKVLDDAKEESKPRDLVKTRSTVGAKILKSQQWIKKRLNTIWGADHDDYASYSANHDRVEKTRALMQQVVDQWTKELGMDPVSVQVWSSNDTNMPASYDPQNRILRFKPSLAFADGQGRVEEGAVKDFEALAHEFGHALFKDHYERASDATKQGLKQAFEQWAAQSRALEGTNLARYATKKPLVWGAHTQAADATGRATTAINDDYLYDFEEWVADQTAQHLANRVAQKQDPLIEQFFRSMAAKLRRLYRLLTGEAIGLNAVTPEFAAFVEGVRQSVIGDTIPNDQEQTDGPKSRTGKQDADGELHPLGEEAGPGDRGGRTDNQPGAAAADAEGLGTLPSDDVGETDRPGDRRGSGPGAAGGDVGGGGGVSTLGTAPNGRPGTGGEGVAADGAGGRRGKNRGLGNYHIADPEALIGGSPRVRFERNKAAIEAYRAVTEERREPTAAERDTMAAYIGWGSFGQELFQGNWTNPRPKAGWEQADTWLREHLGQAEWESAQRSIINAHYTDPPTVTAMWDMVSRLGFKGGRVLEPSMGIGNFFGLMPRSLAAKSRLTGIELDELTGGMAKLLYPDANIQIKGYEESKTADNFYDLVIGNWPFAADGPPDRRYRAISPSLHDYFFLKALDQVRPGGLVIGITSSGTMDKQGRATRLALARKADLVAAFRLPTGAFEKYAGTSVVTDIIILKKRESENSAVADAGWIDAVEIDTPAGEKIRVNQYWQANPDHVLGTMTWGHGTTSGRPGMIVNRPANLLDRLQALPKNLPEDLYQAVKQTDHIRYVTNNTQDRQLSVTVDKDGNLFQVHGEHLAPLEDVAKYAVKDEKTTRAREDQVRRLVDMRRRYGQLIDAERDGSEHTESQRASLNRQYRDFVKAYGPLNDADGLNILRKVKDPFYASLAALEIRHPEHGDWRAARILSEPTVRAKKRLDKPTVRDAFVMARNESMDLDMARIAALTGKTEDEVIAELTEAGAVFKTPEGTYEVADVYLSGNVRRKLREAEEAQAEGADMSSQIAALKKVLPKDVPYFNIEAKLGAPWVLPGDYQEFIAELLGVTGKRDAQEITVRHLLGSWKVTMPRALRHRPEATSVWGTDTVHFDRLLEAAMNNTTLTVWTEDENRNRVVAEEATKQANEKVGRVREEFSGWVWKDAERRIRLEKEYNEVMNAISTARFDGSFLTFEGMALKKGDSPFNLRQHQVDAIWRGLANGRGLYAHEVGTGKTYTMGGIAVESRRYGLARKPLILAHNANSATVAAEINEMYPGAKVLYVDNLTPDRIDITLRQIANDDWDAVVIPHSLIGRLALSRKTLDELAAEQIAALEAEALEAAAEDDVHLTVADMDDEDAMKKVRSTTAKKLVHARNRIINKIADLAARASKEGAVPFEELGIDMVLVDEVHEFKKPPIATKMKMKGLNTASSDQSITLQFLTDYIKRQNAGRGVHIFTGTPITNTLAEIYNMQRYIMDDQMARDGIKDWDSWFNTFADATTDVELTPTGEYEAVTRLASFVNVAELRRMIGQYTDIVFADAMPEFKPRPTPSGKTMDSPDLTDAEREQLLDGRTENPIGRPYKKVLTDVGAMSPRQEQALNHLVQLARSFKQASGRERLEIMRSGDPASPILVETAAANAGLDVRLYDKDAEDHPESKVNRVARNLIKHFKEHDEATQVVFMERGFSDRSVSTKTNRDGTKTRTVKERFNLVNDLVEKLLAGGIPRKQIAIVDGKVSKEKRKQISDAMNRAEIRVVIGNTKTLGVGVNMQRNLRAMHHLDAPWMPGDLEQRNGRGHRQGNQWNTVLEYRYITERLDGRRWQVLAVKDRFIKAFLQADESVRVIEGDAVSQDEGEGVDDLARTLADAAGDPRILLLNKLKSDVDKLENKERMHSFGVADARSRIRSLKSEIETWEKYAEQYAADDRKVQPIRDKDFTIEIAGKTYTERKAADEAIEAWVMRLEPGMQWHTLGDYHGFKLRARWPSKIADLDVKVEGSYEYYIKPSVASLEATLRGIGKRAENALEQAADRKESIPRLEEAAKAPFARAADLEKKRALLSDIEADLQANPIPAPPWLRHGAPVGTQIHVNGEALQVEGHQWGEDNYYVLASSETGTRRIPYNHAKDEHGLSLYEPRPFAPPTVERSAPNRSGADAEVRHSRHSVSHETPRGLSVDALNRVKDAFQKKYPGTLPVKVIVKATQAEAFGPASRKLGRLKGGFDEAKGHIILIAENIDSIKDAQATLVHELVTHFGLRELLGEKALNETLADLIQAEGKNKAITRLFDEVRKDYPDVDALTLAEEVLARASEAHVDLPLIRRIMARLMELLRRAGLYWGGMTLADVDGLISASARNLQTGPARGARGAAANPAIRYHKAWHGTAHNFEQFTTQAIGSGEGAQAYGWGLYFASEKDVATWYRDNLTYDKSVDYEGEIVSFEDLGKIIARDLSALGVSDEAASDVARRLTYDLQSGYLPDEAAEQAIRYVTELKANAQASAAIRHMAEGIGRLSRTDKPLYQAIPEGGVRADRAMSREERMAFFDIQGRLGWIDPQTNTPEQAIGKLRETIERTIEAQEENIAYRNAKRNASQTGENRESERIIQEARASLAVLDKYRIRARLNKIGHIYEVDLAPKVRDYLDWDKPMSKQSLKVRWALKKAGINQAYVKKAAPLSAGIFGEMTGQDLYAAVKAHHFKADASSGSFTDGDLKAWDQGAEAASRFLHSIGIPGIKYLDQMSRGQGEGSHNYVIFDDSLVSVTMKFNRKRNDLASTLAAAGMTAESREAWRGRNQVNQRQTRVPAVQQAAEGLREGKITQEQYIETVRREMPIKPFKTVPAVPTFQEIVGALKTDQLEKDGIVGLTSEIPNGTRVGLRLDIPAYDNYDTWIVSVHDGSTKSGPVLGYAQTGAIRNVEFGTVPKAALNIATGKPKATIARMFGEWVSHDPQSLARRAETLMKDPDWVQVGMNPFRHSWFYDKADGMPLTHADEVIQIGALVLAKNARKTTPDDAQFQAGGIKFRRQASGNATWKDALDGAQRAAVAKIGPGKPKTFKEKLAEIRQNLGMKLRQGVVDQYASLLKLDTQLFSKKQIDKNAQLSSWILARMSTSAGGALDAALHHGRLKLKQGAIDVDANGKGLIEVLKPLGEEVDRWLAWVAGNRAQTLAQEDRENLFSPDDIKALKSLNQGRTQDGKNRAALYEEIHQAFTEIHDSVVDVAVETGLINAKERETWRGEFYVPFYRILEEQTEARGPKTLNGLVKQTAYKYLKGGDQQLNDLLGNTLMNWNHLLAASLKNQAAARALATASKVGVAEVVADGAKSKQAVFVREDGRKVWYEVADPLVLEALTALNWEGFNNPAMKAMRAFKRTFTLAVTASPEFRIANLIRDTVSAAATTPLSTNLLNNVLGDGRRATQKDSLTLARMTAGGGRFSFGHIYGADPEGTRRLIKAGRETIIDSPDKLLGPARKLWDRYQAFGDRMENVNRGAIFEQAIKRNKDDLLRANFEARDLVDFAQMGAWPAVRFLVQTVPFINARIQGLDKLARSAMDDKQQRQFAMVTGMVALASMALYLAFKDDEDFKAREQWDRDTYWWFKIGETGYRIPKPFEVGAIGTLAERLLEQIVDDKVHGALFAERLTHMLKETFAFNPTPQMFQPALELWGNRNTFTDRPIESMSMERLSPTERKQVWTSQTAIGASLAMDAISWGKVVLSPVQIEHLVQGYLGWVGATALGVLDTTVSRPLAGAPDAPAKRLDEYPILKRFITESPERHTRYVTAFYDQLKAVEQAYGDISQARRLGQHEKARELTKENREELRLRGMYTDTQRQLNEINNRMKLIHLSRTLSAEEKRERIDRLIERRTRLAKRVVERRAEVDSR